MSRELVIGLDIGTTSAKAVAFDLRGNLIAEAESMITTYHPVAGWAEQQPKEVEQASAEALQKVMQQLNKERQKVLAIGMSCAMHSLICVDEHFDSLSPMLLWSDTRASGVAEELNRSYGKNIYKKTGTPIHPMTPLVKLIWMKENQYDAYGNATYFMTFKEYLIAKWFGERVTDYAMASSTGLMNVKNLTWDKDALELAGIQEDQLSTITTPKRVFMNLNKDVAQKIGLPEKVPFVLGAADGQLANLGSGAISPGEVNISVGTSGAIRQFVKGAPVHDEMDTFTYAFTEDMSIIGGPTNNGGVVLQWLKDLLDFKGSHDELTALADQVDIGSDGLIFHPYINGERAPLWNGRARGNFYGLTINHGKEHLVRAVLEGIALNIYQIGKSLENIAGKPKKITVNGGLSKSKLWVQMLADLFGQNIYLSDTHHNAAWGAAWTALVGIGRANSFEEIKGSLPKETVVKWSQYHHEKYLAVFKKYEQLADDLEKYF